MPRKAPLPVKSVVEVQGNIRRFRQELQSHVPLIKRLRQARAWYALHDVSGWIFGPSKFVGYKDNTAEQYLETSGRSGEAHGGATERNLAKWFSEVDPKSGRGRELFSALEEFLSEFGQVPNEVARINMLKPHLQQDASDKRAPEDLLGRISVDARICGGRPCISGTRMRVTDIVEAIAAGATREELLHDFDYLTEDDIAAALLYAARAADHRIIRTA